MAGGQDGPVERSLIFLAVAALLLAACQPSGEAFLTAKKPVAPEEVADLDVQNVRFLPGPSDMRALEPATMRFTIFNRGGQAATYTGFIYDLGDEVRGSHFSDTPLPPSQSFDFEIPLEPRKVGPLPIQIVAGVYEMNTGSDTPSLFFGQTESDYDNNAYATTLHITGQAYDCNDRLDNDEDGFFDFPEDPGCSDYADAKEFNVACDDSDAASFRPSYEWGITTGVPRGVAEQTVQVTDFCRAADELVEYSCNQGWIESAVYTCPCAAGICT